jgi:phospholipid/cholesterol/gamma-HCH transport system ATP-binding protein
VRLQFEEKKVLDGVSLKVEPLQRLVVMGQSGSGKSTILRLILGILQPTAGAVFFKQFEISRLRRRKLQQIRSRIGMVYQYSALLSSRNVRDNVALPLEELSDMSRKEIDEVVDEKTFFGWDGRREIPITLGVEWRDAENASASLAPLVMDPELILFDEPSAGLDPVVSSVIDELIISLTEKSKVTSIIVTHEMDDAFRVATQMAMLYHGKIIEVGTPEQLKQSQNPVVAQFLSGSTEGPILEGSKDAVTA